MSINNSLFRYKASGEWAFKPPWHEAGPLDQIADEAEADQFAVNKELSLSVFLVASGQCSDPSALPGRL